MRTLDLVFWGKKCSLERSCAQGHVVNEPQGWDMKASFLVSPGLESGVEGGSYYINSFSGELENCHMQGWGRGRAGFLGHGGPPWGGEWFLEKTLKSPLDCELQEATLVCPPCPALSSVWHVANTQSPCLDNLRLQWGSFGCHHCNKWRLASLSVVSNLSDLSDMRRVAATGLISPLG